VRIPVCTVATQRTYGEFLLLRYSLEKYHDCVWYIACDTFVSQKLKDTPHTNLLPLIDTDDCDHNVASVAKRKNFLNVVLTKFDACKKSIEDNGWALFLDADMVFVNPIEERVLDMMRHPGLDAIISPHMTNSPQIESQHGYYNVGMFVLRSVEMLEKWRTLSTNHQQYGLYYEQQPLEYIHRNFLTANFPINYNLGWWRFNLPQTQKRLTLLKSSGGRLCFGDLPAVNFHFHTLKDLDTENYGKFLVDIVLNRLKTSKNETYQQIYHKYKELASENNSIK